MTEKSTDQPKVGDILSPEMILQEAFGLFHKAGVTRARQLTENDFTTMAGVVQTLEGPAKFISGDFLAIGVKGEQYPIRAETMKTTKEIDGEPDSEGWANYKTTTTVRATQINKPFGVRRVGTDDISYGQPGDWFVDSGKRQFVVAGDIFAETYEKVGGDSAEIA